MVVMLDKTNSEATGGRKRRRSPRGQVGHTGARFGSPALRRTLEAEHPDDGPADEPPVLVQPERARVGHTGARFGSPARRRDREDDPVVVAEPEPEPEPELQRTAPFSGYLDDVPEPYDEGPSHSLVRPYAWTGGRTASTYDLRLETLVSVEESGIAAAMRSTSPEQRSIVEICALPRSVAEVSAMLAVPLGVARVLLGDLIGMGVVTVHDSGGATASARPDFVLMERVLAGLRQL